MVGVGTNRQLVLCCLCKAVLVMWSLKKEPCFKTALSHRLLSCISGPWQISCETRSWYICRGDIKKIGLHQFQNAGYQVRKSLVNSLEKKQRIKVVFVWLIDREICFKPKKDFVLGGFGWRLFHRLGPEQTLKLKCEMMLPSLFAAFDFLTSFHALTVVPGVRWIAWGGQPLPPCNLATGGSNKHLT